MKVDRLETASDIAGRWGGVWGWETVKERVMRETTGFGLSNREDGEPFTVSTGLWVDLDSLFHWLITPLIPNILILIPPAHATQRKPVF